MPLDLPVIDDRSYQQILSEALARIPVHNPDWTNFNDSDPGVTLIQLFAFMTENLLYRSNLIPERNRIKFLQLLGVPMRAAEPARGIITFSNPRGPLRAETLSAGTEVFSGKVPFRTDDGLDVLPLESRLFYKQSISDPDQRSRAEAIYKQLYMSYALNGAPLDYYQAKPLDPPVPGAVLPSVNLSTGTLDGALWLALLARQGESVANTCARLREKVLTLGILPSLAGSERVLRPGADRSAEVQPGLVFELATPATVNGAIVVGYPQLDARPSGDLTSEPGVVELSLPDLDGTQFWRLLDPLEQGVGELPPSLEDTTIEDRVIAWIRIRASRPLGTSAQLDVALSWIGINAARVTQRAHVSVERLGLGTGDPDQMVALVNTPVIPGSVQVMVGDQLWQETDDLLSAPSEVPSGDASAQSTSSASTSAVFTVDRESGRIRFGDGLHGARPGARQVIQARYDYGGGRQGMVGIGAITKAPSLPAGLKVTNEIPTWGGDEAESVGEAEQRIPEYLRHRDRLISKADFEEIARSTPGVDLGRVVALPLFHPSLPDAPAAGVVTVMVIPRYDAANPETPEPDQLFLDTVCEYLDPRRVITTEVHVRGPEYVRIWVSIGINVLPGRDIAPVRESVKQAIRSFLSPLVGGFEESGWPLQKSVDRLELWAVASRVDGIAKVKELLLTDDRGTAVDSVAMTGLDLPRLAGLAVQSGDPLPLADLRGEQSADALNQVHPVAIPVIGECC